MADEINHYSRTTIRKGQYTYDSGQKNFLATQTGDGVFKNRITISTSDTAISFPNITNNGVATFENLDDTNFVTLGATDSGAIVPFARIRPGESWDIRLDPSMDLRAQADTASVDILITVHEA